MLKLALLPYFTILRFRKQFMNFLRKRSQIPPLPRADHGRVRSMQPGCQCLVSGFSKKIQNGGRTGGSDELVSSANPSSPAIVTSRQEKRANAKTFRKWRRCLWQNSTSSSCFPYSFQLQMVLCLNTNVQS